VVQVIGLSRWFVIVPGLAAKATDAAATAAQRTEAASTFETAHRVLGSFVGETLGYSLTAAWTVAVLMAAGSLLGGRWFKVLGLASATLIFLGVFIPLGLPGADQANFVGYIIWSVWVLILAVKLLRPVHVGAAATGTLAPSGT
jgi:hypothetical protein